MTRAKKESMKLLLEALDDFPKIVAQKKKRAKQRALFVEKTFGTLARRLDKERKKMGN